MESSTLRRSNLSKEKIAVLEALSKYKQETVYDNAPTEYVRPNKERELDLLWQNFKISNKSVHSPSIYLAVGFVAGAVFMALLIGLISNNGQSHKVLPKTDKVKTESVNLVPASSQTIQSTETYTVQSGDTIEGILIRFYGSYSSQKAEMVKKANNLSDINKLQIGQKLLMPMN